MTHEIRNRIVREANPEGKERHGAIRRQIEEELPELRQWASAAAARRQDRMIAGTVLTGEEVKVLEAVDNYAAQHSLRSRSGVMLEARGGTRRCLPDRND
jgi:hypothetical protein